MTKQLQTSQSNRQLTTLQKNLINNIFLFSTRKKAALQAGYSKSTAPSAFGTAIKNPIFQDALKQHAIDNNLLNIPILSQIEAKIYKKVLKKPSDYSKYKEVFKQTKQIAGILDKDAAPGTTIINVKNIEKVQVALGDMAKARLDNQG